MNRPGGASSAVAWTGWTAENWNEALFRYFFVAGTAAAEPVTRLLLTDDELARATSDPAATSQAAKAAFLRAVKCTPAEFRKQLSDRCLENGEWRRESPPPFIVWLMVTCYAASSGDSETINEGDFRRRLQLILAHPDDAAYPLSDLPRLWLAFLLWLRARRREGDPYRALVLPDPGYMSRIGYSARLAFPPWRDRSKLVRLLTEQGFTGHVPMRDALELLGARLQRGGFSKAFSETFESARKLFLARRPGRDLDVLWSTICEAAALAEPRPAERQQRIRYQLFLEVNDDFLCQVVLAATAAPTHAASLRFAEGDVAFGQYRFIAAASQGGAAAAARFLLENAAATRLTEFQQSPVRLGVEQGILLFQQDQEGHWEFSPARPDEDRVRSLIRRDLVDRFRSAMGGPVVPSQDSMYPGWVEVGPFDASRFSRLDSLSLGPLESVRCLQRTTTGIRIRISEGVPIGSGYLGMEGMLPAIVVDGADSLGLYSREGERAVGLRAALIRDDADGRVFRFPDSVGDLDGAFTLLAERSGEDIAARSVVFRARVLSQVHLSPTAPDRWMVEGAGPDVVSADSAGRAPWINSSDAAISGERVGRSSSVDRRQPASEFTPKVVSIDSDVRLDRFVEAMAAISSVRRGISEGDFLDALRSALRLPTVGIQWDIARAWVEAGYFDVLSRRNWRGRVYFANDPKLVVSSRQGKVILSLLGLAAYGLRGRVDAAARSRGGLPEAGLSFCSHVAPPAQWAFQSVDQIAGLSDELTLPPPARAGTLSSFVWPVAKVCAEARDRLLHYEVRGVWDWRERRFVQGHRDPHSVRVTWLSRLDRPDYFLVEDETAPPWRTFSRNWALLVAHWRAGSLPYRRCGTSALVRGEESGAHLPLPVARALALAAGVASGPWDELDGKRSYVYQCRSAADRTAVEGALWGDPIGVQPSAAFEHLLRFLKNQASASSGATVVIPAELRRALRATSAPGASVLASRQVAAHLLPHLRRLCSLARN